MFKSRAKARAAVQQEAAAAGTGGAHGAHPFAAPAPARHLLALEPRFMFDAAAVATGAEVAATQIAAEQSAAALDARTAPAHGADAPAAFEPGLDADADAAAATAGEAPAAALDSALRDAGAPASPASAQIVFIDRAVPDAATLLQSIDPAAEVIFIEAGRDGLAQMAEALQGRTGLAAIHVLSHGDQGEFTLGGTRYDAGSLDAHAATLQAIGAALSADGDLLLYGCEVAGSEEGQRLIDGLAQWTGADVAASTDTTGAASLGGDWTLEASAGLVEARALAAPQWEKALATGPLENAPVLDLNGQTTGRFRVGWLHNYTPGATYADAYMPDAPGGPASGLIAGGWDRQLIASTGIEQLGLGLSRTVVDTRMNIGLIDQPTLPAAMAAGDYLEYSFRTVAGLPPNTVIDRVFHGMRQAGAYGDSHISVVVSNDNFATSQVIVDHHRISILGSGRWTGYVIDSADYALEADTNYQVRIVFHDHQGGNLPAQWDDFQIGMATDPSAYTTTFTEDTSGPVSIGPNAAIEQAGSQQMNGATVTLNNPQVGDRLLVNGSAATSGTIGAISWTRTSTASGIGFQFSGSATAADYAAALQQVQFENTLDDPVTTDRIIETTVSNAAGAVSEPQTTTVRVVPVNDAPVLDLDGSAAGSNFSTTYAEDGPARSIADTDISVTDVDNANLTRATVTLTNAQAGDVLTAGAMPAGITAVVSGNTVTLTGSATLASYQAALRAITFSNTSDTPSTTARTIDVVVNDGAANSNTARTTIAVTAAPVAVDDSATTDEDVPVSGNVLSNDTDVDSSHSALRVTGFTVGGITATAGQTATLAGVGTLVINADGSYTFTPAANYHGPVPVATYTVSDGALSDTGTLTLTVAPQDDPVVNNLPAAAQATPEDDPLVFSRANGNAVSVTDVDSDTQTVTLTVTNGTLSLSGTAGLTFAAGDGSGDATMTFTGRTADINAALEGMRFTPTADYHGPAQLEISTTRAPTPAAGWVNGGFENPVVSRPAWYDQFNENVVPGWDTTASDNRIEIWSSGMNGGSGAVSAYEGNQFAEVNANQEGALSQVFSTTPGSEVTVDFAHRGRNGVDVLEVIVTDLGTGAEVFRERFSDGQAWNDYSRVITPSASGNDMRFEFRAVSTAPPSNVGVPANSEGNFVDGIRIRQTMSDVDVVPITVTPVRDVLDDALTTPEDTPRTIDVLANDSFEDVGRQVTAVTQPANGSVSLDPGGNVIFTPDANWNGTTSFTYTVTSGGGLTETATVTVTVAPDFDPPVAVDDSVTTREDTPASGNVLANDSDIDSPRADLRVTEFIVPGANGGVPLPAGSTATIAGVGTLAIHRDGSYLFTPAPDYDGAVPTATYTVSDGTGTDTGTLTIGITPVNDPPTPTNDRASAPEDSPITGNVLDNDSDVDNPDTDLSVTGYTLPGGSFIPAGTPTVIPNVGTLVIGPDGSYSFTPVANYAGPVPVATYTLSDGNPTPPGTPPVTATLSLSVTAVNDPPVAADDSVTIGEDTRASGNVLANDSDIDGPARSVSSYTVAGINGGTPTTVAAGNPVTVAGVGTFFIAPSGAYTFTPEANYAGPVPVVTYTVTDGDPSNPGTDTATLTVNITPANDPPVAVDDSNTTDEDTPATGNVLANDGDIDSPQADLRVTSFTVPGFNGGAPVPAGTSATLAGVGTFLIEPDGSYSFTPAPNYTGAVPVVDYTVSDGDPTNPRTDTGRLTLSITPVNDDPVAVDDSATTPEDSPVTLNLTANDIDADRTPLTITQIDGTDLVFPTPGGPSDSVPVTGGSVVVNADGTVTFTPTPNSNVPGSFSYTVEDPTGVTATANVAITVTPENDPPVAVDDTFTTAEDTAIAIDVLDNDDDIDGNPMTVTHIEGTPVAVGVPVEVLDGTRRLGSVELQADGRLLFTPEPNYHGPVEFDYTISDGAGGTSTAAVAGTVTPVNDPPVAADDVFNTDENRPTIINILGNDVDPDGDLLALIEIEGVDLAVNGTHTLSDGSGTVTRNPNNTLTFTPATNYNGPVAFAYTVSDPQGNEDTATVQGTVDAVDSPPTPMNDSATIGEDSGPVVLDVLDNDSDPDNPDDPADPDDQNAGLQITGIDGQPIQPGGSVDVTGGTVTLNADGTLSFDPTPNYNGTPSFTYTVSDPQGLTGTATVNLTVTPVNDPPVAGDDLFVTPEDTPVTLNVRGNDSDIDSNPLTITAVDGQPITAGGPAVRVTGGSVSLNPDGTLEFTPDPDTNTPPGDPPRSFTYTISDPQGASDTATVQVNVSPRNDPPVAVNDVLTATEDTALPLGPLLLGNDRDVDGDTLTITAINGIPIPTDGSTIPVVGGSVDLDASGALVFNPAPHYNGPLGFDYTIADPQGETASASVSGNVAAVNDPPVAQDDSITIGEDSRASGNLLVNDSDVDGPSLQVTGYTVGGLNGGAPTTVSAGSPVTVPGVGTFLIEPSGAYSFTPEPDYDGPVPQVSYTVGDGDPTNPATASATLSIAITPVNDPPVAQDDSLRFDEDTEAIGNVLDNDSDVDGPANTVTSYSVPGVNGGNPITAGDPAVIPGVGTLTIRPDGSYTFSPEPDYDGAVPPASYTVSDGSNTRSATLTLSITPVNDVPVASAPPLSTPEDTPVTGRITASDVDGDPLAYSIATPPQHGTLTLDPDGSYVYTPDPNYNGPDTFTITVSDGQGGTVDVPVPVTVAAVNDVPVASAPPLSTAEDTPVTGQVTASDIDGDPLAYTVSVPPQHGTLTLNPDGSYLYTPDPNYNGPDSFTITVDDGQGGIVEVRVPVTVSAVNDAPVALPDLASSDGTPVVIDVLANDFDVEGGPLTITHIDGQPISMGGTVPVQGGTVTLQSDGTLRFEPTLGYVGSPSFSYTVADPQGATAQGRVAVGVDPYPAADVQTLVNMGAAGPLADARAPADPLARVEAEREARRTRERLDMYVPPFINAAVNGVRGLDGTAVLDVRDPLRVAVNGIRGLDGLPDLDVGGPVLDVVNELERRFRIVDPVQALFEPGGPEDLLGIVESGDLVVLPEGQGEGSAPAPAPAKGTAATAPTAEVQLFSEQLEHHALRAPREVQMLAQALAEMERELALP